MLADQTIPCCQQLLKVLHLSGHHWEGHRVYQVGQMRSVHHQDHTQVGQICWPMDGSISTARRNPEMASLLPQKVFAPSWSKAATAEREKQLSVESRRGHKGKEEKEEKCFLLLPVQQQAYPLPFTCTSCITPDYAKTNTIPVSMVPEKFLEKPVLKSSLSSQSQTAVITNQCL